MEPVIPNQSELVMSYKTKTLAIDAPLIASKSDGNVDLLFLQMNTPGQPVADVVAAVRLGSLDALKALRDAMTEHIEKEENKEA